MRAFCSAKSYLNILCKQNIPLRRKDQYRSTVGLNIARRKANIAENAPRFHVKLRLRRSEARFAREARLRRMMCLPLANVKEKGG